MKASLSCFLLPLIFNVIKSTLCHADHQQEIHKIMKRMAENGDEFEGHDIARVMILEGRGQNKRRLVKRDLRSIGNSEENKNAHDVQLHLSSGSKINLALKSSGIVDSTTKVSHMTPLGRQERKLRDSDCYTYGNVQDSSGEGWAAFSHCDGLYGFAGSSGYEYFVHPVEVKRNKRDANDDYDVHVMWRRSTSSNNLRLRDPVVGSNLVRSLSHETIGTTGENNINITPDTNYTKVVIELAMFSDAHYCERLQKLYPGREDDFLLIRLAAVQALYSNKEKVGYDVQIKVKLLEYWIVNPENYTFGNTLGGNLRSFCSNTRNTYSYDVRGLNTGITANTAGKVGLAYVNGACTSLRCFVMLPVRINQFVGYAHELGHTLGMTHFANCPQNLKSVGGFMGGGSTLNFSPCMKYQFNRFLNRRRSSCLFRESSTSHMEKLADVLPGQSTTPDELCHILAGPGYKYVQYGKEGNICQWWVCIGNDETYPDFGRARRFPAPYGFPCSEESFCLRRGKCQAWNKTTMALDIGTLRSHVQPPQWSSWSTESLLCSRSCGTGVRIRTRDCQFGKYNLSPPCQGPWFKARLCNTDPCPGDPTTVGDLRRARGDEICSRFLADGVDLTLKGGALGYLNTSSNVVGRDVGMILWQTHSKSCMMKCDRDPITSVGDLDGFLPAGTPCSDRKRKQSDMDSFGISLRCVRGVCTEFSDCPEETEVKDDCGICGGDGSRCTQLTFGRNYDVPMNSRITLHSIPAGSENVQVIMDRNVNIGVILELWNANGNNIIGRGGRYPGSEYIDEDLVPFAGTNWSYNRSQAFLRARGPISESVVIKAFRSRGAIRMIQISYARPLVIPTV